ncbi:uncharacterized protein LOC131643332 [Vicia villosa]|uniref:uncharacterized protein LOC131643332 n=1 Tax=Vicia villosa TaxID=3911 RepID=UPI00273CF0F6|nr:uncharacterized protein LOC131643332 [Vicia villosa]
MPIPPKIPFIDEMSVFMHKYIKQIINVLGDGNCGYQAVSALLGNGEDSHTLIRHQLIQEFKTHKDSYTQLYGEEVNFEAVYDAIVPWLGAYAPVSKWMRFPEMRHLIACAYNKMVRKIETFCRSLLETGCPIPPTPLEWTLHHTADAEMWSNLFVDIMYEFERLNNIEKESNAEKSKLEPPIDLAGDSTFDLF